MHDVLRTLGRSRRREGICKGFSSVADRKLRLANLYQIQQSRLLGSAHQLSVIEEEYGNVLANIQSLCQKGCIVEAAHLLGSNMTASCLEGCICLLQGCGKTRAYVEGKWIHAHILVSGQKLTIFLLNTLVTMYIRCGAMMDARCVFDKMAERNVFTWTLMIAGYAENDLDDEALDLFCEMQQGHVKADLVAYLNILKVCSSLASLRYGKLIHAEIIADGFQSDLALGTALLDMYAKCGSLDDTQRLFEQMPNRDVPSWDVIIAANVQQGNVLLSVKLYLQMQLEGVIPDKMIIVNILKVCANVHGLDVAKQVHSILTFQLEPDSFVETGLVYMYAKRGCIQEAQKVFDNMLEQDIVSWGVLISAYAQHEDALNAFLRMQLRSVVPDSITFVGILKACANIAAQKQGKRIHACITNSEFESNPCVRSVLIDMYAKCGSIETAQFMFSQLLEHDVVCWNVMISGYVNCGNPELAMQLFWQMQGCAVIPNDISFASALRVCSIKSSLEYGRRLHTMILSSNLYANLCIGSTLIDMYAKCECLNEAINVFKALPHHDVVLWNSMLSAYVQGCHYKDTLRLFWVMQKEAVPSDLMTLLLVLKACTNLGTIEEGRKAHCQIVENKMDSDVTIANSLIDMYVFNGSLDDAQQVFDSMPDRNVVTWNSLILGYLQHGLGEQAVNFLWKMEQEGVKPNEVTFTYLLKACNEHTGLQIMHGNIMASSYESSLLVSSTLIDMYSKLGNIEQARQVFDTVPECSLVAWTTMIRGYSRCGFHEEAVALFSQMQLEGVKPDSITFLSILNSCANVALVEHGKRFHVLILENDSTSDTSTENTLVNMYFKCGGVDEAAQVFERMTKRDAVSWSVLLEGYALNGHGSGALQLINQMQEMGMELDQITWIGVLAACSYAGLVDEGCAFFHTMLQGHFVPSPSLEHYTCIIDLLGRAGHLEEAEELIDQLPVEPDVKLWSALLGACQIHGNTEMAKRATEQVLKLEPDNASALITLLNLDSAAGSQYVSTW